MKLLVPAVVLCLTCLACSERSTPADRPNVLFIAVDDLRPELGCYGKDRIESPHIDHLAAQGTRLDRSYCNIPVCGASRASLMTGLRPARNRFLTYLSRADEEAPGIVTLPGHFHNHGYHTISNGKIFHHDDDDSLSWEEIWHPVSNSPSWRDYALDENILRDTSDRFRGPPFERARVSDTTYKDGKIAEKTIADLRKLKETGQPFFLATGFYKPHLPFNAPEKYWALYDGKSPCPKTTIRRKMPPKNRSTISGSCGPMPESPRTGPVSDEMAERLIHGYYACVSYTDAQVGKILEALKELKLDRSTLVILWGDHGWNLREHGLWCKHCNFETSLHTPLIVKVPGKRQVVASDQVVEYVDIYPHFANWRDWNCLLTCRERVLRTCCLIRMPGAMG
jgi:iduronate 2-sulfatase